MPLVTFCGSPVSGKSTLAFHLFKKCVQQFDESAKVDLPDWPLPPLVNHENKVVLISNHDPSQHVSERYLNGHVEKKTRGEIKALVQRHLTAECIVILDALNEIKGYRFELFRLCQELKTPHVVITTQPRSLEQCLKWNSQTQGSTQSSWPEKLLTAIYQRMEWPNGKNRWDKPLFTIDLWDTSEFTGTQLNDNELKDNQLNDNGLKDNQLNDNELTNNQLKENQSTDNQLKESQSTDNQLKENQSTDTQLKDNWSTELESAIDQVFPFKEIWDALHDVRSKKLYQKPKISTNLSDTTTLYELERVTLDIITQIQKLFSGPFTPQPNSQIVLYESKTSNSEKFLVPRHAPSIMNLKRLRQQFIKLTQSTSSSLSSSDEAANLFITYLNQYLQNT